MFNINKTHESNVISAFNAFCYETRGNKMVQNAKTLDKVSMTMLGDWMKGKLVEVLKKLIIT